MMTREEEILSYLEDINPKEIASHIEQGTLDQWTKAWKAAAARIVISALRPVSREQVEKVWRASWNPVSEDWRNQIEGDKCSACGFEHYGSQFNFCPNCGAPMTDEAVEMVMERINEMEETTDEH